MEHTFKEKKPVRCNLLGPSNGRARQTVLANRGVDRNVKCRRDGTHSCRHSIDREGTYLRKAVERNYGRRVTGDARLGSRWRGHWISKIVEMQGGRCAKHRRWLVHVVGTSDGFTGLAWLRAGVIRFGSMLEDRGRRCALEWSRHVALK